MKENDYKAISAVVTMLLLQLLFILLKLFGTVDELSWFIVLIPLWCFLTSIVIILISFLVAKIIERIRER